MSTTVSEVKTLEVGAKVWAHINSLIGNIPSEIVRDRTDDPSACIGLRLDGERVYEVRYLSGPFVGQYSDVPARNLLTVAMPERKPDED